MHVTFTGNVYQALKMYTFKKKLFQIFQINEVDVHLYKNALSGRDIVECTSAVCAIRPCQNGAVCTQHEDNGKINGNQFHEFFSNY